MLYKEAKPIIDDPKSHDSDTVRKAIRCILSARVPTQADFAVAKKLYKEYY